MFIIMSNEFHMIVLVRIDFHFEAPQFIPYVYSKNVWLVSILLHVDIRLTSLYSSISIELDRNIILTKINRNENIEKLWFITFHPESTVRNIVVTSCMHNEIDV